jgi:hypothetical protein
LWAEWTFTDYSTPQEGNRITGKDEFKTIEAEYTVAKECDQ